MLVLTRSTNQSIMIGPDIVVTVLEVRGDNVRLGIQAPRSVAVYREEVIAQLEAANKDASSPSSDALDQLRSFAAPPIGPSTPVAPAASGMPAAPGTPAGPAE